MTLVLTILAVIAALMVTYAVFILPHRTNWAAVSRSLSIYDTPQSFTEVGLEAEWGTPPEPKMPELQTFSPSRTFSRPGRNNVVYALPALELPPVISQGRRRTSTVLGVVPAVNNQVPGSSQMNRSELATLVRENLCTPECSIFVQQDNHWMCQCGAVTKHANHSTGIASRISRM